jgi:hypothetical protein
MSSLYVRTQRGDFRCVGRFVFFQPVEDSAVAPLQGATWKALARDLTADIESGDMGRCTLRALTFWGNVLLPELL